MRSKPLTTTGRPGRWKLPVIAAAGFLVVIATCIALIATGVIWPNRVFASSYPTRGVDVSSYQGAIDWDVLSSENIDFAIIKATEGSGSQDERFANNWSAANETDLLVGAYHFMSFETEGATQAQNIIETVPKTVGMLPVTVDLEFYGDFFDNPPTPTRVRSILDPLLEALENHYGQAPIIYATPEAYDRYLQDGYLDNPIWTRSVAVPPRLSDGRAWTIWQYSNRDRLRGYDGEEYYIDMNVFAGTIDELRDLAN